MTRTLDEDGLIVGKTDAIYTFSGGIIQPLNPDPTDIHLADIAHALSNQCRYTGHTRKFYSVAEHSILCSFFVEDNGGSWKEQITALLHDASEAYLSDIARPIKKAPEFGGVYVKFEKALEHAIGLRFGIPTDPFVCPLVKQADECILGIEVHTLMPDTFREAYGTVPEWPTDWQPRCWAPATAERLFIERYAALRGTA